MKQNKRKQQDILEWMHIQTFDEMVKIWGKEVQILSACCSHLEITCCGSWCQAYKCCKSMGKTSYFKRNDFPSFYSYVGKNICSDYTWDLYPYLSFWLPWHWVDSGISELQAVFSKRHRQVWYTLEWLHLLIKRTVDLGVRRQILASGLLLTCCKI